MMMTTTTTTTMMTTTRTSGTFSTAAFDRSQKEMEDASRRASTSSTLLIQERPQAKRMERQRVPLTFSKCARKNEEEMRKRLWFCVGSKARAF